MRGSIEGVLNTRARFRTHEAHAWTASQADRPFCLLVDHRLLEAEAGPMALAFGVAHDADDLRLYSTGEHDRRVVIDDELGPRGELGIELLDPAGGVRTGIAAGGPWTHHAREAASELGIPFDATRRALVLMQLVSSAPQIDGWVCDEPLLHEGRWSAKAQRAPVLNAGAGCAVIGLALRARGDFRFHRDGNVTEVSDPHRFYEGAVLGAVPALRPWHEVATAALIAGHGRAHDLHAGALIRLARALRARDHVLVRARAREPRDVWPEILLWFEVFLVEVMGALDASSRMVEAAFLGRIDSRRGWKDSSTSLCEKLGFVASLHRLGEFACLVASLRNFVHERAPSADLTFDGTHTVGPWGNGPGTLAFPFGTIALHRTEAKCLLDSLRSLSDSTDRAGVRVTEGNHVEIMVLTILPWLLRGTLEALDNALLELAERANHPRRCTIAPTLPSPIMSRSAALLSGLMQ